jgi:hypothetical protein
MLNPLIGLAKRSAKAGAIRATIVPRTSGMSTEMPTTFAITAAGTWRSKPNSLPMSATETGTVTIDTRAAIVRRPTP